MELQEQINALTLEKQQYISMIGDLNSEKIALDQMLVETLKQSLTSKKDVVLKDIKINDLMKQVNENLEKLNTLTQENESLKNSLSVMQANAETG